LSPVRSTAAAAAAAAAVILSRDAGPKYVPTRPNNKKN